MQCESKGVNFTITASNNLRYKEIEIDDYWLQ